MNPSDRASGAGSLATSVARFALRAALGGMLLLSGCGTGSAPTCNLPKSFKWSSTGPIISPISDARHDLVSIKDPSIVFFDGKWHVYASIVDSGGNYSIAYLNFTDWSQAGAAPQYYMDQTPGFAGYHAAPQLFYFTPQKKWYLVYQSGPPSYSTADDPSKPSTWTAPQNFFPSEPENVAMNQGMGTWIDFWVICDSASCYLFFSDDNGHWYRSKTGISQFPSGFDTPVLVMQDAANIYNLFEASNVYKLQGQDKYMAIIEAIGAGGNRFFRSWTADSLEGTWTPLADTEANPFAGATDVTFTGATWTDDISHGEMLRAGYDETLTIDPCNLRYLYQGKDPTAMETYNLLPWKLGLLTKTN